MFAAASDVGSEGKAEVQEDPQGRWQGTWGDEATVTGCHQVLSHQKKGQDWHVKTMSGETPLTQKKPLKAQCFFTLIICAVMSDIQRSHPGCPLHSTPTYCQKPPWPGRHSVQVPQPFPGRSSEVCPDPTLAHVPP